MAVLEGRLRDLRQFKSSPNHPSKQKNDADINVPPSPAEAPWLSIDNSRVQPSFIEDDHIPFMDRGVDILHLIPYPFPGVWHTMADDGDHLDIDTVEDWSTLITSFTAEWLELEGFFDADGDAVSGQNIDNAANQRNRRKTEL
jgi:hypothetical protein